MTLNFFFNLILSKSCNILVKKIDEVEAYIFANKKASVTEIIKHFGLSESTIRRYINQLEASHKITKEYGAILANTADNLLNIRARINHLSDKKVHIAQKAFQYVQDGDTLFFDSGTTHMHMAKLLREKKHLTIVTNNLLFAVKLADLDFDTELIIIPGYIRNSTLSASGDISIDFMNQFYFDCTFLTTSGLTLNNGFSNRTLPECSIKRKLLAQSQKNIVLADDSKFGQICPFSFANFEDIDYLITNKKPHNDYIKKINHAQKKIIY